MSRPRHVCGVPGPGERLLEATPFDAFERDALTLIRLVCAAMGTAGDVHVPSIAAAAGVLFPPAQAAALAEASVRLVRAAALGRVDRFAFSNPACPACARVLTVSERLLMEVVHAARRRRRGAALVSAILLCDRAGTMRLVSAAEALAAIAPPVGDADPRPARASPSRAAPAALPEGGARGSDHPLRDRPAP